MSLFKDVIENASNEKKEVQKKHSNKKDLNIPEGIQFTDVNMSKIVISVDKDNLMITKYNRGSDSYIENSIVLQKEFLPFLGSLFLDFYKNGNLKKTKAKLEKDF